jgi:putative phage-type endonuclease
MGENPWKTPEELLEEKCSGKGIIANAAMARGTLLEPEARRCYEKKFGIRVMPACLQSLQFEWLRASVDGLEENGISVVEIKCGESVYRKTSLLKSVPSYYYGQLQHILAITQLESIDFFCYLPEKPEFHLKIRRDDPYIKRLIDTEQIFWMEIQRRRKEFDLGFESRRSER